MLSFTAGAVWRGNKTENTNMLDRQIKEWFLTDNCICFSIVSYEPRCEKTGLRGFRPGPTQTGLYSHRRWLEA